TDGRVVEPGGMATDASQRYQLIDGSVGVDHEMRTRARKLSEVGAVRRERVEGGVEARPGGVVLHDDVGMDETPRGLAVVPLRVSRHLGFALRVEWDRLLHDRRPP